jgi:hypothetical protein
MGVQSTGAGDSGGRFSGLISGFVNGCHDLMDVSSLKSSLAVQGALSALSPGLIAVICLPAATLL